jgi:hypothetical protein
MRVPHSASLGLFVVCAAGGCASIAGIEDLALTGAPPDASTGDAADDTGAGDVSARPDSPLADAPADSRADSSVGAPDGAAADSATPPIDATEAGITYEEEVLSDHPLAYWRFGETSGTTAVDSSGNGHDGTYVGGVTLGAPGAIANDPDTSVSFDGATAWMNAGDIFQFAGTVPCSFEAWVNPTIDANYHEVLSRSDGQGPTTVGTLMYVEPTGSAFADFAHRQDTASDIASSSAPVTAGAFTHLVGVYDGSNVLLYVNGALAGQKPTTLATPAATNPFVVGAQSAGLSCWFDGPIDEVAVYGAALPAARIAAHYKVGTGQTP